jgi:hypothetical protein
MSGHRVLSFVNVGFTYGFRSVMPTTYPQGRSIVPCSQPSSGSVTSPTGSVNGNSMTGLTDAYTGNYGGSALTLPPQWQHVVLLTNTTGACAREGCGGGYAANEITLRLTMIGYWNTAGQLPPVQPPSGDLPLTFQADGTWLVTSDGVNRQLKAYFMKARSNGGAGSDELATSGSVTLSTMTSTTYDGSYDIYFGTDHITGTFVAPWCT